jgi:hypothetical protein
MLSMNFPTASRSGASALVIVGGFSLEADTMISLCRSARRMDRGIELRNEN